jgi:hypothetical protein
LRYNSHPRLLNTLMNYLQHRIGSLLLHKGHHTEGRCRMQCPRNLTRSRPRMSRSTARVYGSSRSNCVSNVLVPLGRWFRRRRALSRTRGTGTSHHLRSSLMPDSNSLQVDAKSDRLQNMVPLQV